MSLARHREKVVALGNLFGYLVGFEYKKRPGHAEST